MKFMPNPPGNESPLIISYLTLRKLIGLLGMGLPFVMALGGWFVFAEPLHASISDYYYTGMRDAFVGILFAMGVFLLSYHGYERADFLAGKAGGLFVIGVALFPTAPGEHATPANVIIGGFHYAFAALFYLTIACFSLFLFTKTNPARPPTVRKRDRNRIYILSGWTIIVCLALIFIYKLLPGDPPPLGKLHPVFLLETIANLAFGFSWIVKGETFLKDI
jgi:hypothetical protein